VVDVAARAPLAWSFGAEHVRERADSTFILGADSREVPVRRATTSLFGEARLTPAPSLLVTAGVRTERIGRAALPADPLAFPPRPLLDDTAIWSTNPKLSVVYAVGGVPGGSGATTIRANLGTGIRAPDAFEVAFTDNPALAPERTRSADAGVERVWLGGRLVGEAVAFWNRYDDLIVAVGSAFANASRFRTDNISNARSRGLELAASARPHRALAVRAAYTWLDTAILAVDGAGRAPLPFEVGSPLVRRPRHQASVHAIWTTGRTSAYLRVLARGRVLDVDPSFGAFGGTLDAPGYGVADVGGQLSLGRGVAVTVRVANLFDRRYEEVLGYPSLGRHAIAGVRVALGR
jgi:outer membrane receptor protein involved in Fe transport